jgi:hypothetical protein
MQRGTMTAARCTSPNCSVCRRSAGENERMPESTDHIHSRRRNSIDFNNVFATESILDRAVVHRIPHQRSVILRQADCEHSRGHFIPPHSTSRKKENRIPTMKISTTDHRTATIEVMSCHASSDYLYERIRRLGSRKESEFNESYERSTAAVR